jgi:hypothetical protein
MKTYKFKDVVDVVKVSSCKVCSTYIYTMSHPIDVDFGDYLLPFGQLQYPLKKIKIVLLDSKLIRINSRVGRNFFEIKFKTATDEVIKAFNIQIAAYLEEKTKSIIDTGD